MTIKTTIALEFNNRYHRDEFLRAFQRTLFAFGNIAPKCKIKLTLETEAEFGDPSAIDLLHLGVESGARSAAVALGLDTPMGAALAASEPAPAPSTEPEPSPAVPLTARVLQSLAVCGPLTVASLADQLSEDAETVQALLERLHAQGDVEPDDGERWALSEGE